MPAIVVDDLTKRFGKVVAVDGLSFSVTDGSVTGFLGPNGAGKTTSLRILLGLVRATSGRSLVNGRPYAGLADPLRHVGAVLEATSFHPGRSARDHLRIVARMAGLSEERVDDVLEHVGLTGAADRRVGGFSLGMRQRLSLGVALLGDPEVLILDEPTNGLDPEGIHWLRGLLRRHAGAGGTVLISSHQIAELSLIVDEVVIVHHGQLVSHGPVGMLTAGRAVVVRTPQHELLLEALAARGIPGEAAGPDVVRVTADSTDAVGRVVAEAGIVVYEMRLDRPALEAAFLQATTEASSS